MEQWKKTLRTLLGRFVTVSAIDAASTVLDVDFATVTNQLDDRNLMIGFTAKQVLIRLPEEGEPGRIKKFHAGVHALKALRT